MESNIFRSLYCGRGGSPLKELHLNDHSTMMGNSQQLVYSQTPLQENLPADNMLMTLMRKLVGSATQTTELKFDQL